jgi:hypothetical protein
MHNNILYIVRTRQIYGNAHSVDVIQIGLPVADIPASIRGLYDAFTVEQVVNEHDGDFTLVRFLRSGETVMTANAGNTLSINSPSVVGRCFPLGRKIVYLSNCIPYRPLFRHNPNN